MADDQGTLVFVEVKARVDAEFGTAAEAVTPPEAAAAGADGQGLVVREQVHDRPCRFDVVAIMFDAPAPRIELYQNAFDA